jgi:transcriptional regulator with XRE-family HTH domain
MDITPIALKNIGDRLRTLRMKYELSVKALSFGIDFTEQSIRIWEKGSLPQTQAIMAYSEYFGVSTDWILYGKESEDRFSN